MSESIIHIVNGEITNKITLRQAFNRLKDGRYIVKIDNFNKRSLNQNAYYHGVVVPLVKDGLNEMGYKEIRTNEDAHEVLKSMFLKKQIPNEHGEFIELNGSTAKLTTVEFMEFKEDIQQWAAEYLGINIPDPNEQLSFI